MSIPNPAPSEKNKANSGFAVRAGSLMVADGGAVSSSPPEGTGAFDQLAAGIIVGIAA